MLSKTNTAESKQSVEMGLSEASNISLNGKHSPLEVDALMGSDS